MHWPRRRSARADIRSYGPLHASARRRPTSIRLSATFDTVPTQARVYDAAKQDGGLVGGPYYADIRLPKLFKAAQNLRGCLCVRAAVAPRSADRQPRRRPALGRPLSVVRAGARLARRRHRAGGHRRDQRAQDAGLCRRARADLLCGGGRTPRQQGPQRRRPMPPRKRRWGCETWWRWSRPTGSFSMTCMTANTFEIDPPADNPPRARVISACHRIGSEGVPIL